MYGDRRNGNGPISYGMAAFCATIVIIIIFAALWDQRQTVAWILLGMFGFAVFMFGLNQINEMILRHRRYHQGKETPLAFSGYVSMAPRDAVPGYYSSADEIH